jgi:dienelactone hydrolase
VTTKTIEYKCGDVTLQGYIAYVDKAPAATPGAGAKRPGVLVFAEWWGLNDYAKRRARELAELGYVALAADMYGQGATTKDPQEAAKFTGPLRADRKLMRARARAALDVLAANEVVDPKRIGAIGYCFGGTVALELARSGADVAGTVSFHGGLDTPDPADAKNIKGKILACNGADDPHVTAAQVEAFEKEMRDAKVDWQLINYGGAVHAFTNPDAGKAGMNGVAYNASADRRSWQAMVSFFHEVFGG